MFNYINVAEFVINLVIYVTNFFNSIGSWTILEIYESTRLCDTFNSKEKQIKERLNENKRKELRNRTFLLIDKKVSLNYVDPWPGSLVKLKERTYLEAINHREHQENCSTSSDILKFDLILANIL